MNRFAATLFTAALFSAFSMAQGSVDTQASVPQSTSVSVDKSDAQVNANTSADTSQHTAMSGKHGESQISSSSLLNSGTTVQTELIKPVDASKNKPGDEVVAKTTQDVKSDGRVMLPKGSRIVGKVTQAQTRAKGQQESQLGISFDHAILKDGSQIPVSFAIQAISSSQAAASAAMTDDSAMMEGNAGGMASASGSGGNRGLMNGVSSTAGSVVNTAGSVAGTTLHTANATGTSSAGGLTSTSHGVIGIPGLTLSSMASGSATAGSVIRSSCSNVHLESGTRMLLSVNGQ